MPALPESIFDICYLIFAVISGILLLKRSEGRKEIRFYGLMTMLLGCGDAFGKGLPQGEMGLFPQGGKLL